MADFFHFFYMNSMNFFSSVGSFVCPSACSQMRNKIHVMFSQSLNFGTLVLALQCFVSLQEVCLMVRKPSSPHTHTHTRAAHALFSFCGWYDNCFHGDGATGPCGSHLSAAGPAGPDGWSSLSREVFARGCIIGAQHWAAEETHVALMSQLQKSTSRVEAPLRQATGAATVAGK